MELIEKNNQYAMNKMKNKTLADFIFIVTLKTCRYSTLKKEHPLLPKVLLPTKTDTH